MRRAIRHLFMRAGRYLVPSSLFLVAITTGLVALEGDELSPSTEPGEPSRAQATTGEPVELEVVDPYPSDYVESDSGDISMASVILKLGLGLGVVVLLVWGSVAVLRKSSIGKQFSANTGRIRVIERSYLGPKKSICLVRIGKRALALGVTEGSITTLAELDDEDLPAVVVPTGVDGTSFVAQFRSLLSSKEPSRHLGGGVNAS